MQLSLQTIRMPLPAISQDVQFEQGKKNYSFPDETLMDDYRGKLVSYRIRRSSTTTWQWGSGSGHQTYQLYSLFMLPVMYDATLVGQGYTDLNAIMLSDVNDR